MQKHISFYGVFLLQVQNGKNNLIEDHILRRTLTELCFRSRSCIYLDFAKNSCFSLPLVIVILCWS